MEQLRRIVWRLQLPMIVLLPLWLTAGRGLLGSIGWLLLIMLFLVVPLMLIVMTVQTLFVMLRKDVRSSRMVSAVDAKWSMLLYVSTIVCGFFLVDFGDSEGSMASVASSLLGDWFLDISALLSVPFATAAVIALFGGAVTAVVEFARSRHPEPKTGNSARNKV